ncbi:MAG: cell division protein ZapA [Clostridia bacterium]|nr:cell division protein ZapA [Clostridia bacterium]MBQ4605261.1 cell division protein ZapA [Clostridia bacterium]
MEQNTKRKIAVEIAGVSLTLVTDENGAFVDNVVAQVNEKMEAILAGGIRTGTSTLDAALLCAIDSVGERLKAEKRMRNLEAQLSLYEVNVRNLKEELEKLQQTPAEEEKKDTDGFERLSQTLRAGGGDSADDKIRTLERYLDSKKSGQNGGMSREEKIRYIESLLRGNEEEK